MRRAKVPDPKNRDGIWYLIRRVPKNFEDLDRRRIVRISTNIAVLDDPRKVRAKVVVEQLNLQLEAYWQGMRDGQSADARLRFEAAQKRARALGTNYQTVEELRGGGDVVEALTRIELLITQRAGEKEDDVAAVLGGEGRPRFRVSDLPGEYEKVQAAKLTGYSDAQVKRWRNPKVKAATNFVEAVSDKYLDELTRADAIAFREWWQTKLVTDNLEIGTANKDIGHMNKMHRMVDMTNHLGLLPVFSRLRLEGETTGSRAAFSPAETKEIVLSPELDRLNDEARDIVLIVAELGLRPSEVCGVLPHQIRLGAPIPLVAIVPEDRQLKNPQSERELPLVGNALAAFRRHPNGFPTYRDKADTLSATVNKALRKAKLLPTKDHTLYSLRHAFEDRLIEVETPDKVVASMMGHKFQRPKYGKGPTLELKARWLSKVLLPLRHEPTPPASSD
ncbi:integrase [Devosia yakushimensis]|uniref:Integrase n=1 Tax=Devosia yakushimensis TaxID=470028 RepID=A0ABQ5UDE9_9HYPH|nr:tyrosine-type recombinase/integrase [Devosia yakushimensis]GLQ09204.1 integrase [Devosia yakushimensis]